MFQFRKSIGAGLISATRSAQVGNGSSAQCWQIGRSSSIADAGRSPQKAQIIG